MSVSVRVHELLAESLAEYPEITFLNYGWVPAGQDGFGWILPEDLADKYHLALVDRLLGARDLAGASVLEIGAGRGGNCAYLAKYSGAGSVIGLDSCAGYVAFCGEHWRMANARFHLGDAERLPFADSSFDVVVNLESSHCYRDFSGFLKEARRVLVPGGLFCFADVWNLEFLDVDWDARRQALVESRFVLLSREDVGEGVLRSIYAEDGLIARLERLAGTGSKGLFQGMVRVGKATGLSLSLGRSSYEVWRLRKA
jgi:O-methyltransferase